MEALQQQTKIRPVFDGTGVARTATHLFTSYGSQVVKVCSATYAIEKEIEVHSTVSALYAMQECVIIATVSGTVYTYSPASDRLEYLLKDTVLVKEMTQYEAYLAIGTADGIVMVVDVENREVILRKVLQASISKLFWRQASTPQPKKAHQSSASTLVVGDVRGGLSVLDARTGRVFYADTTHTSTITLIEAEGSVIYTGSSDGCLHVHEIGNELKVREVGYAITAGLIYNDHLVVAGNGSSLEYYTKDLAQRTAAPVPAPRILSLIVSGEKVLLVSEENDLIIGRMEETFVVEDTIIGDNDEITDILVLDDVVVVATNSAMLRVLDRAQLRSGEYACTAQLVQAPNQECSLVLAGDRKHLFSGTKDGYINRFAFDLGSKTLAFKEAIETPSPITALCIHQDVLLSGSDDGSLKCWKKSESTLLFTAVPTTTEITGIAVIGETIICTSKDKEIKRIDFRGVVSSGIPGHKKGIWALDAHNGALITSSSDKTVRFWRDGACTHVLQHNASVVKALLRDRVVTATSEGVVRVWDAQKEKELAALKISAAKDERIWSIKELSDSLYVTSAGGSLFVLKDNTKEIERQKEEAKKERYITKQKGLSLMNHQRYLEAAVEFFKLDTSKEIKEAVKHIDASTPIQPLVDEMGANQPKALKCVSTWTRSPQLFSTANRILQEILQRRWPIDHGRAEDIASTLSRTTEVLHETY
ncbi:U3 small nucleolar RNA-associated protein 13 [Nematocida displodere]|uniref:U3 small nucleolar RNA-associated protein 13 n=1 Tax=Nematocida displodere TaxID=1805483 RepID=A0A177ELE7_9MICR|nr:U3 small nucleolar RNA-associated protein 13 [Nematocida displodere]